MKKDSTIVDFNSFMVVNVSVGHELFTSMQKRLLKSCQKYNLPTLFWTNSYPPNSRTHLQSPYGFKLFAIEEALKRGCKKIIYLDSSMWIDKDPTEYLKLIEEKGLVILGGRDAPILTKYISNAALKAFDMTRSEADHCKLLVGGLLGLDFSTAVCNRFFDELKQREAENLFRTNGYSQHRHDEAIMGLMVYKRGFEMLNAYSHVNGTDTVFRSIKGFVE